MAIATPPIVQNPNSEQHFPLPAGQYIHVWQYLFRGGSIFSRLIAAEKQYYQDIGHFRQVAHAQTVDNPVVSYPMVRTDGRD